MKNYARQKRSSAAAGSPPTWTRALQALTTQTDRSSRPRRRRRPPPWRLPRPNRSHLRPRMPSLLPRRPRRNRRPVCGSRALSRSVRGHVPSRIRAIPLAIAGTAAHRRSPRMAMAIRPHRSPLARASPDSMRPSLGLLGRAPSTKSVVSSARCRNSRKGCTLPDRDSRPPSTRQTGRRRALRQPWAKIRSRRRSRSGEAPGSGTVAVVSAHPSGIPMEVRPSSPKAGSLLGLDPRVTAGPVVGRATPVAVPSATARMPVGFRRLLVPKAARVSAGPGLRSATIPPTRRRRAGDRDPRSARIPSSRATGPPTTCPISTRTATSPPRRLAGARLTRSTGCERRSPPPEA